MRETNPKREASQDAKQARSLRRETLHYDDYDLEVVGGPRLTFADLYHVLLTMRWWAAFLVIVTAYLALNALFALAYTWVGGVSNVRGFLDAFFFSVQTMGTIGYGTMAPVSVSAHVLVVLESIAGLVTTALATGLVFVRFSRVKSKIRFSEYATISPMEGVPTLTVRVGNERRALIVDVNFRLAIIRTVRTQEGVTMYRPESLKLVRDESPALVSAITLRHHIDAESPLAGDSPETFAAGEVELALAVRAIDDTSLQSVHARRVWNAKRILWGARLADVMEETSPTKLVLDLRKFDDVVTTASTKDFPYPRDSDAR